MLYKFSLACADACSLCGYKHTLEAKAKMKARYLNKKYAIATTLCIEKIILQKLIDSLVSQVLKILCTVKNIYYKQIENML